MSETWHHVTSHGHFQGFSLLYIPISSGAHKMLQINPVLYNLHSWHQSVSRGIRSTHPHNMLRGYHIDLASCPDIWCMFQPYCMSFDCLDSFLLQSSEYDFRSDKKKTQLQGSNISPTFFQKNIYFGLWMDACMQTFYFLCRSELLWVN